LPTVEQRIADQVGEIERMRRLRRFLLPQVADLIVASGTEQQLDSHRREITNVASRLCDEAKPGQTLISPRVLMAFERAVTIEPVGEFTLKGIRRPMMTYNVLLLSKPN
jgi:hypothetical protein